MYISVGYIV